MPESVADDGQGMAGISQLPTHQHHQRETEEEENQPGNAVLDADDLVVGRDNVFPPERQLVVVVTVIVVMRVAGGRRMRMFGLRSEARASVHKRKLKLNIRAKISSGKRLFAKNR